MDRFQNKVLETVKKQAMIPAGSHVIAGLSGGMDSVCLLFVLLSLRRQLHFEISAVHVNHGLRGADADADQQFVEKLCAAQDIRLRVFKADVRALAEGSGRSVEEAGRDYRYRCFRQAMEELKADRIAVAHHRDDLCETLLMNLCRGTGIGGIAGIPAVRDEIIRPLIDVSRSEIGAWVAERGLSYREDATNADDAYTRNRIRHEIMPLLRTYVNAQAMQHMADAAKDAAILRSFAEQEAHSRGAAFTKYMQDQVCMQIDGLLEVHEALRPEIIHQALTGLAGSARDISRHHILDVLKLTGKQSGRKLDLPYGLEAVRDHDTLVIRKRQEASDEHKLCITDLFPPCRVNVTDGGMYVLCMELLPVGKNLQIPKNQYTKWLDYDRMSHRLALRTPLPDDYLVLADGKRKKLRRVLMDAKVSREKRDKIHVLAAGNHVVWIPALNRISDDLKITQMTEHILEIRLEESAYERDSKSIDTGIRCE